MEGWGCIQLGPSFADAALMSRPSSARTGLQDNPSLLTPAAKNQPEKSDRWELNWNLEHI